MERIDIKGGITADGLHRAVRVLQEGGVLVFPAERLYGLGARADLEPAVQRVFELKGRRPDTPAPVLAADSAQAQKWAETPEPVKPLIEKFWPGPLTLVLEAKQKLPGPVAGSGKIGIRVPGNQAARELCRALGSLLTATSANASGQPPARTADQAAAGLAAEVDLILDAGELPGEPGSTVAEPAGEELKILRPGVISIEQLQTAWKGIIK